MFSLLLQVHNVAFSFELMQDAGLPKPKPRPEGMLNDISVKTPESKGVSAYHIDTAKRLCEDSSSSL